MSIEDNKDLQDGWFGKESGAYSRTKTPTEEKIVEDRKPTIYELNIGTAAWKLALKAKNGEGTGRDATRAFEEVLTKNFVAALQNAEERGKKGGEMQEKARRELTSDEAMAFEEGKKEEQERILAIIADAKLDKQIFYEEISAQAALSKVAQIITNQ